MTLTIHIHTTQVVIIKVVVCRVLTCIIRDCVTRKALLGVNVASLVSGFGRSLYPYLRNTFTIFWETILTKVRYYIC